MDTGYRFIFIFNILTFYFYYLGYSQSPKIAYQIQFSKMPYSWKTLEIGIERNRFTFLGGFGKRRNDVGYVFMPRHGTILKYEPWSWTTTVKFSLGQIKKRIEPFIGISYLGCFYSYQHITPDVFARKMYHRIVPISGINYHFCRFAFISGDVGIAINKGTFGSNTFKHLTSFGYWPVARISVCVVFGNPRLK